MVICCAPINRSVASCVKRKLCPASYQLVPGVAKGRFEICQNQWCRTAASATEAAVQQEVHCNCEQMLREQ